MDIRHRPEDLFQSRFLYVAVSVSGILFMIPYFMTNATALGILLENITGLPFGFGAAIFILVSISYCMHGGLRAIANTDVFHGVLLIGFFILGVAALVMAAGGFATVLDTPKAAVSVSQAGLKVYFMWIIYVGLVTVVWPDRSLRMYAVRDEANLRRAVFMTGIMLGIGSLSYLLFGLAVQKIAPGIANTDTAMPTAVQLAAAWLMPFYVVNAWGSGMSNFSAGMLSTANIFVKDIYQPLASRFGGGGTGSPITAARILMAVLSAAALLVCLGNPPFIWSLVNITLGFFLQLSPMFILGLYWDRSSRAGAVASWITGVALAFLWTFVLPVPFGVFPGLAALVVNTVVYVTASLLIPDSQDVWKARRELLALADKVGE